MSCLAVSVDIWLTALGLQEYIDAFSKYASVQEIINLTEVQIKELGIKNGSHRAKIASNLLLIRNKASTCDIKMLTGGSPSMAISNSYTPSPCSVDQENIPLKKLDVDNIANDNVIQQVVEEGIKIEPASVNKGDTETRDVNLRQYIWYHGAISRLISEKLMLRDGDFLVRDSTTHPGDYVLTCCWKGSPLHFVINQKVEENTNLVKYQFEERLFTQISELVQYYVSNMKPVSELSGAILRYAVRRGTVPEPSWICGHRHHHSTCPSITRNIHTSSGQNHNCCPAGTKRGPAESFSSSPSPRNSSPKRRGSAPLASFCRSLGLSFRRSRSSSPTDENFGKHKKTPPPVKPKPASPRTAKRNVQPAAVQSHTSGTETICPNGCNAPQCSARVGRMQVSGMSNKKDRPKVLVRNVKLYEDDGKDYTDYDQVKAWKRDDKTKTEAPKGNCKRVVNEVDDNRINDNLSQDYDFPSAEQHAITVDEVAQKLRDILDVSLVRVFDPSRFHCEFLPPNNKVLDLTALNHSKHLLECTQARELALHLTQVDAYVFRIYPACDLGLGIESGLELMSLHHGHNIRLDILERHHCLVAFTCALLLTTSSLEQRASLLTIFVNMARELRDTFGNLFSFSSIMTALQLPQISRLDETWKSVSPSVGPCFSRLVTQHESLSRGSSNLPLQSIAVPHIIALSSILLEQQLSEFPETNEWYSLSLFPVSDIDIVLAHLNLARLVTAQCGLYTATCQSFLADVSWNRNVLQVFLTDFHLRLLWGSRGATANRDERYVKFNQLLHVLSNKIQPNSSN